MVIRSAGAAPRDVWADATGRPRSLELFNRYRRTYPAAAAGTIAPQVTIGHIKNVKLSIG